MIYATMSVMTTMGGRGVLRLQTKYYCDEGLSLSRLFIWGRTLTMRGAGVL